VRAPPLELVIAPEAELDTAEAWVWYEGNRAGLGEEFLSSVDACLESIRRRPEMYPVVHQGFGRAVIRRFPYAIFYERREGKVTVYAVFHTSRDPGKWRQRLP
jgi:toxin ParE1/3/4